MAKSICFIVSVRVIERSSLVDDSLRLEMRGEGQDSQIEAECAYMYVYYEGWTNPVGTSRGRNIVCTREFSCIKAG